MLEKLNQYRWSMIALMVVIVMGALFYQNKRSASITPRLLPFQELGRHFESEFPILDHFIFDFDGDLYFFRAYFSDSNDANVQSRLALQVGRIEKETYRVELVQDLMDVEHVRHARKVQTPWGEGVVVIDHGFDHLSHGGRLRLFIFNRLSQRFDDFSDRLPFQKRIFAFNVAPVRNESGMDDLLISIVNTVGRRPMYFKARPEGYDDWSDRLPNEWRNKQYCFMTSHEVEVHSGEQAVYLGACDQGPDTQNSSHDRIIVWRHDKWVFLAEEKVPARDKDKTWGTVAILKASLGTHQLDDIAILTHNYGFSLGNIRLFQRVDDGLEPWEIQGFPHSSIRSVGRHYFHHLQAFDLNGDGHLDLIGTIRYIDRNSEGVLKTDFALLNNEDSFRFVADALAHPLNTEVISLHALEFEKLPTLVVFYHDGQVNLYR
jgi:hypothetical protein